MKKKHHFWMMPLLLTVAALLVFSCSKERSPVKYTTHPEGWNDPASANFHGSPFLRDSLGGCVGCHGTDLRGGTSGVSCYDCHAIFPHPMGFNDTLSTAFHGTTAKTDSGRSCQICHGADYQGGIAGVSCFQCHAVYPHVNGWQADSTANGFHGWVAMQDQARECKACHGATLQGNPRGPSCYDCHSVLHIGVSNEQIVTHRRFVADKIWNLANCQVCHGQDFAGGRAVAIDSAAVCITCHTASGGPTDCSTCHGLPPVDDTTVPFGSASGSAGAHYTHAVVNGFSCSECHPRANGLAHIHALPATANFDRAQLANLHGFAPTIAHVGQSNSGNAACSNLYCHSDGMGHAATVMPQWTVSTQLCGACHSIPPSLQSDPDHVQQEPGQPPLSCSDCHTDVDPTSNFAIPDSIRFLADSLHVDNSLHL